jgi:hypothetical protein
MALKALARHHRAKRIEEVEPCGLMNSPSAADPAKKRSPECAFSSLTMTTRYAVSI